MENQGKSVHYVIYPGQIFEDFNGEDAFEVISVFQEERKYSYRWLKGIPTHFNNYREEISDVSQVSHYVLGWFLPKTLDPNT